MQQFEPHWWQRCFQLPLVLLMVSSSAAVQGSTFEEEVRPFLVRHCLQCHNATQKMAEINLESFDPGNPLRNREDTWRAVLTEIRAG